MKARRRGLGAGLLLATWLMASGGFAQPSAAQPGAAPEPEPGPSAADATTAADDNPLGLVPPSRETDIVVPAQIPADAGETSAQARPEVQPPEAGPPGAGPTIDLPPELTSTPQPSLQRVTPIQFGATGDPDVALSRGLAPERMARPATVVGGYGQFTLNSLRVGPDDENDFETRASVRRMVLFVAHPFTNAIRAYTEFEWENAIACSSCAGSVEIEQAFLDWQLIGRALTLRAGLVLVPMGIVNQWHEPPVFHGVDRPAVDTVIIPSTWRELGLGVTGQLTQTWRYELYLTTALDPLRLDSQGLGGSLGLGSLAKANAFAVTGRMEFEPLLGIIAGAAFYTSDLGPNGDYYRRNGRERDLSLPLFGYAFDARMRRYGLEARALWTQFHLPNSGDLMAAYRADGSPLFPNIESTGPVPTRIDGGYIELAYDALFWVQTGQQLLAFVRLERYDTQAAVPDGYDAMPELDLEEVTFGLTYRPLLQLVWKLDVQLRDRRYGLDELQVNAGFGYMF